MLADVFGVAWFVAFGLFSLSLGLRPDFFERIAGRGTRMTYEAMRGSRFVLPRTLETYVKLSRAIAVIGGVASLCAAAAIVIAG